MNNENLKPFTSEQSRELAVKNGRKGGIASAEARKRRKTLKEELEILLKTQSEDGRTYGELMSVAILKQSLKGNTKAFEVIRDTIGEKPIEQVQQIEPPKIVDDING